MIAAVVYSQPSCAPCIVMKRALARYGVPYVERDVRVDDAAMAELVEFHECCAPGRQPATPLVVIDDADGHGSREILFGPAVDELKALVRDARVVA